MKFNVRNVETKKIQGLLIKGTLCSVMTVALMGLELKPHEDTNFLNHSIKTDFFAPETALANTTSPISVYVNGSAISFTDAAPFIENGRTMVPLRGVFETMGYEVDWNAEVWSSNDDNLMRTYGSTNPALITIKTGTTVLMSEITVLKDNTIMQSGAVVPSDAAPKMTGGRYYLPLRAIAEATGAEVSWNNDSRRVDINFSSVSLENDQAVVESNQGANYVGKFGDASQYTDASAFIDSVGFDEAANLQNYNHKIYYENAPAGNAHGLPEGAYYVDTDNAVSGEYTHSLKIGGATLMNGQSIYIGESRASIESKFGEPDAINTSDGDTYYKYYDNSAGVQVAYTDSGRVKIILVQSNSNSGYTNKGFSYGTGGATLGNSKAGYSYGPGEVDNYGSVYYHGAMFGTDVGIGYEVSTSDGKFSTVRITAKAFENNQSVDPF
ncbi:MAG: copper amine oxidase N-terminal domain-containing protein [Bacillota bacterium]